ncbi:MAG: Thiamine-triphosphatase [candidate division TM6 bacterium GW2011_GWF2_38_10]|nr:MAG: Thiamine-triphosphatase [candidate division TM6 bacterium GW2011_GWF2_38_10]
MIEVELKCFLSPEQEEVLIEDALFIGQEELCDVYYDLPHYELSLKDFWLRKRNGVFLLKTPAGGGELSVVARRNEYESHDDICRALELPLEGDLEQKLIKAGYQPLYTLFQMRRKYKKDDIAIDLDRVTFDGGSCERCELEILVERQEDVLSATERLVLFAQKYDLQPLRLEDGAAKLIGLIKKINPEHYALLQEAFNKSNKE